MKQQRRKEIESSVHGLLVKRFNHYLYRQCVTTKRVIAKLRTTAIDSDQLQQRLAICAKSLDNTTRAEKSNAWAMHGQDKIKLATELIQDASNLSDELKHEYADSLANYARYSLNLSLLLQGLGALGKVDQSSREQSVINVLLICSHTLNGLDDSYKPVVSLFMDRAKLLNWIAQSNHLENFGTLWATALQSAVLTLCLFLESQTGQKCPNAVKLNEQLLKLKQYENEATK